MRRHVSLFLAALIALAMVPGVFNEDLYGPDETRDAEIARETLVDGHWIAPRLCGLPYMENPPLFGELGYALPINKP